MIISYTFGIDPLKDGIKRCGKEGFGHMESLDYSPKGGNSKGQRKMFDFIKRIKCDHEWQRVQTTEHTLDGDYWYTVHTFLCPKCMKKKKVKIQ